MARIRANCAAPAATAEATPDKFLLKDYYPRSVYRTPKTEVIDVHCRGVRPIEQLDQTRKLTDMVGIEKTVILTGASTPERFAEVDRSTLNAPPVRPVAQP